ncbi:hypothetical protein AXF42_Ash007110 [Apostasia shenzhenica]|uniref:Uncharacterized protein n=1 Tax=Apostasia shenzhenica TaxID=1088818 RepID=A0A2I0BF60_9ASPA|nr:hypothetical protein AXF42_Ash007110 [Apostasia shenzhenica]
MSGGGIFRPASGAGVMGTARFPLLPAKAVSRPTRPTSIASVIPYASRSSSPALEQEGVVEDTLFGPAPSREEAEAAISDLRRNFSQYFGGDREPFRHEDAYDRTPLLQILTMRGSSARLGSDQKHHKMQLEKSNSTNSQAQSKVFNALRLLQLNPSVQRMVVSLSSDKALWDAIMKNEMVQELKKSYHADKYIQCIAGGKESQNSDRFPDIASQILSWLFENAKVKAIEFIENIMNLVHKLFYSGDQEDNLEIVSDVVRSSFMLSVLVFIIVILKRAA